MDLLAVVVSEDELLRSTVRNALAPAGWRVQPLARGHLGEARAAACVLLDAPALLPECPPGPRRIVLCEPGAEDAMVAALEAGADDCLSKPLRAGELVARLAALLRRGRPAPTIDRGPIRIDPAARRAYVGARALALTPTELALLEILARDAGRAFHRLELLRAVFATELPAYARNVDCHVTRLRRKLEAAGLDPAPISTVHGTGYRFQIAAG